MQSVLPWVYFPSKVFPSESLLILLFRSTSPRLGCPRSHASRLARSNEPSLQKSLLLAHSQPLKSRLDSEPMAEATNTMSNRLSGGPGRCSLADSALFSARGLPTALVDACASFLLGVFDVKDQSEDESPRSNTRFARVPLDPYAPCVPTFQTPNFKYLDTIWREKLFPSHPGT